MELAERVKTDKKLSKKEKAEFAQKGLIQSEKIHETLLISLGRVEVISEIMN